MSTGNVVYQAYIESTRDFLWFLEHYANQRIVRDPQEPSLRPDLDKDAVITTEDLTDAGDEWFEAGREVGLELWP